MANSNHYLMGKIIFDETLVSPCISAENAQSAIMATAETLVKRNFVCSTYPQAVWEREQSFPTGLALQDICIAIPHTDIAHVSQSAIAIGILRDPVIFKAMGDPDSDLEVRALFMLAIRDPGTQIDVLQKLVDVFQREGAVEAIIGGQTPMAIAEAFRSLMES